jgi:hypothetical protein
VVYGIGDGRVFTSIGDQAAREIVKLSGVADSAAPIDHLRVAVHSSSGELARVDLASGRIERAQAIAGTAGFVLGMPSGVVVIAEDDRVLMWDTAVVQLAKFEQRVKRLARLHDAVAVTLADNETHVLELRVGAAPVRVFAPGRSTPRASDGGDVLVGLDNVDQLEVVELPSRARWTVPAPHTHSRDIELSSGGRRVYQRLVDHGLIWQLPRAPVHDFGAWIDRHTNARVDRDGELIWPSATN